MRLDGEFTFNLRFLQLRHAVLALRRFLVVGASEACLELPT